MYGEAEQRHTGTLDYFCNSSESLKLSPTENVEREWLLGKLELGLTAFPAP